MTRRGTAQVKFSYEEPGDMTAKPSANARLSTFQVDYLVNFQIQLRRAAALPYLYPFIFCYKRSFFPSLVDDLHSTFAWPGAAFKSPTGAVIETAINWISLSKKGF